MSWDFNAPVAPGDVITADVEVLSAREDKPIHELATRITNQDGVVVLEGTAVVWRDPEVAATAPAEAVFHIVVRRTPGTWDALMELVERHELPLITSENRPDDVAPENWCKYVLARRHATGREVAGAVTGALTGDGRAAMALIDELAGGAGLVPKVAQAARRLRLQRPDLRGRWGVLIAGGPRTAYTRLNPPETPAIDELLRADATLALELYPRHSAYCAAGRTASRRDQWMADFFQGGSEDFLSRAAMARRPAPTAALALAADRRVPDHRLTPSTSSARPSPRPSSTGCSTCGRRAPGSGG